MTEKTRKEIEGQIETVRSSRDGCGQVVIKLLKRKIVSIQTQFNFNMEEEVPGYKVI